MISFSLESVVYVQSWHT